MLLGLLRGRESKEMEIMLSICGGEMGNGSKCKRRMSLSDSGGKELKECVVER